MNRKFTLTLIATLAVLALLSLAETAAATGRFYYDFESTVKPWAPSLDSAVKDFTFTRATNDNGCPVLHGNAYAMLKYIPSEAASAAWMETTFEGTGSDTVTLFFRARNMGSCEACKPVLYVNKEAPVKGYQFIDPNPVPTDYAGLDGLGRSIRPSGWKSYQYQTTVAQAKLIHIAIGLSGSPKTKGAQSATIGIDCVAVNIEANTSK